MKFAKYSLSVAVLILSVSCYAASVTSLSCTPTTVASGGTVTCTIGGSGEIDITTSDSLLSAPDDANAPGNFTVKVGKVTKTTTAAITASRGKSKFTVAITITPGSVTPPPPPPTLTILSCANSSITGAGSDTCTALLSGPETAATTISLSSSSPSLTVPKSISVAAGASNVTFSATAKAVTTATTATVIATLAGNTAETTITLEPVTTPPPPVTVKSLSCAAGTITGPGTDACTVMLSGTTTGSTLVSLASSNASLSVPSSVTVITSSTTGSFTATATAVATSENVNLTATLGASSVSFPVTLQPPTATAPGMTLSASALSFGNVNVGSSPMQSLVITSSGNAPLVITSIAITGPGFTETGAFTLPLTLAPGGTASVSVVFAPTTTGADNGSITITSNVPTATVGLSGTGVSSGGNAYSLPTAACATNNSCITAIGWETGADLWNGGALPVYPAGATCNAPTSGDAGAAINSCITAAAAGTAVILPAGSYTVNTQIKLKSGVVLRGAKAEGGPPFMPVADASATTLVIGNANAAPLTTQNFSSSDGSLTPATTYAKKSPGYAITNAPKKGDTTFTTSTIPTVGEWISVFAADDPTLVNANGTDGNCQWCGENTGFNMQIQIVQVTSVSGNTVTISKPFYFTLYTSPQYRKYTMGTTKAGFENLRIDASKTDIGANQIILLQGCVYCWVKNVETYMTGGDSGSAHVEMDYTYGTEVRDSSFHDGRSTASGSDYGVYFQFPSSDAKVENNILFHNRHSIVFQGGGSGLFIGYNYIDDMYTDDLTYFASARTSHGAHPFMNLFEGNIISHIAADDFWGTSSHDVFFRNWLRGGEPNTIYPSGSGIASFPPNNGFEAVTLYTGQTYYSFIDNVLGSPATSGGVWPNWSDASLTGTCTSSLGSGDTSCDEAPIGTPIVYDTGGALSSVASSTATINLVGNYDFKTQGVASNNKTGFTYTPSLYYTTKPSFMGSCPFPAQGSDLSPVYTVQQPAYQRAAGATCGGIVQ